MNSITRSAIERPTKSPTKTGLMNHEVYGCGGFYMQLALTHSYFNLTINFSIFRYSDRENWDYYYFAFRSTRINSLTCTHKKY